MAAKRVSNIGYAPGAQVENNVVSFLAEHAQKRPHKGALRWVDGEELRAWNGETARPLHHREITYASLQALIGATARGLSDLGIRAGDRVIIFLPMGVAMYTAMFAVQWIGAVPVFLDSWARRNHLGASAKCVDPRAMISFEAAFHLIREVPEFARMEFRITAGQPEVGPWSARLDELSQSRGAVPICPVYSEQTALVTFTTGSSGEPKGANRTHRFLSAQHSALTHVIPYREDDLDMPGFPIFSLNNLATGVTTILPALDLARPSERDAPALVTQIVHERLTCMTLSPSLLNKVSRFCIDERVALPSLRRVVTGGAPVSRDDVSALSSVAANAEIWVLYGSTEVEPIAHIEGNEMRSLPTDPDPEIVEEGVNVGHMSDDLRFRLLKIVRGPIDLAQTPWASIEMPPGEVGELVVTGDHVCREYFNNDEAFRQTKIVDHEGAVWHRTGDLGYVDPAGYLWLVGRVHNAIQRDGRYYFPVRAEVILRRCVHVRQGAFLGLPDPRLGERNVVAVELREPETEQVAQAEILRLFAKNRIPIDGFFVVEEIPMDPRHHSKVEYDVLRDRLAASARPDVASRAPGAAQALLP